MKGMRKIPIPVSSDYRHLTNRKECRAIGPVVRKSSQKRKERLFGFVFGLPMGEQPTDAHCASMGNRKSCYGKELYNLQKSGQKVLFGTNAKRKMNYSVCREVSFRESV